MVQTLRNSIHRFALAAVACLAATAPALAQRIQFPTMVEGGAPGGLPPTVPAFPSATYPAAGVPPPAFDPYAGSGQAPALLQPTPLQQPAGTPGNGLPAPTRFVQQIRFEQTYLARRIEEGVGILDLELSGSFAFPFAFNPSPFTVTPGFAVHYWDGPDSNAFPLPYQPDLPPRAYDAYLDVGWKPVINNWLSADLGVRVGVYSDFSYVDTQSIRFPSRGLAILTFSPTLQAALGVVYLDRYTIKLLPAGGLIWTPNPNSRYEIIFPRPKLSHRLTTWGQFNTDIWIYVVGEFGGGAWTITRTDGHHDRVNYDDYRVNLGFDLRGPRAIKGWFEVGYVFGRQFTYIDSATPSFNPGSTVLVRGGVAF